MVVTNCLSIHKLFASGYVWAYKKGGLTLTLLRHTREQQSIVHSNQDMIRWLGDKDQKQSNATLLLQNKGLMLKMIYLVSLWLSEAHWVENIIILSYICFTAQCCCLTWELHVTVWHSVSSGLSLSHSLIKEMWKSL